tara:strand:- start:2781 stop:3212 length:432 start_codon:yes stop_codon:yes gene_type:complete
MPPKHNNKRGIIMSFEYLVMTKEELVELFGEPIDDTPVDPKQLMAEGWGVYDEDGKDTTNVNYGRDMSGENNPMWGKHHTNRDLSYLTPEFRKNLSESISQAAKKRRPGTFRGQFPDEMTPEEYREYKKLAMRRWREKQRLSV